jgi:hypothetical protein
VPDVCRFPNEHPDSLGPLFQALLTSFAGYDWRDGIAGLALPRLVIHGAADAFPLEGSREWVPAGSNARLLVIDRAGTSRSSSGPTFLSPPWTCSSAAGGRRRRCNAPSAAPFPGVLLRRIDPGGAR